MRDSTFIDSGINPLFSGKMKPLTPKDDVSLREALKGCSAATGEAAREFRRTGNPDFLPAIVHGLIERYVAPDLRSRLGPGNADLRLTEHLGLDSLTLMELAIQAEDVLQITIDNKELRHLHTVGDLQQFIATKFGAAPQPKPAPTLNGNAAICPQRDRS
jgi:Phosphopantetheine attachment site